MIFSLNASVKLKIFLDTLDITEIKKYLDMGMVDGITSNPSLVYQSKLPLIQTLKDICSIVTTSISAEVSATDYEGMVKEGEKLSSIGPQITVKLPLTPDGLKACKYFTSKGITVNITLCFSVAQAILAAKAGATYVSPFIGRLEDNGVSGLQLIRDIVQVFRYYTEFKTQVLAASLRNTHQVVEVAKCGVDIVTIPPKILNDMVTHPLTTKGVQTFVEDWKKSGQSIIDYE
jgi:transaldolase